MNMDDITEARRKAIAETIRIISNEDLKSLGEQIFPDIGHPWRDKFFDFIAGNAGATFHLATMQDRVQIIYCREKEKGIWFLPGSGMGPMQAKGLTILKEIVDAH